MAQKREYSVLLKDDNVWTPTNVLGTKREAEKAALYKSNFWNEVMVVKVTPILLLSKKMEVTQCTGDEL